jgi:hypothetical protein
MISPFDVLALSEFDTRHWHSICDLTLTLRQSRRANNGAPVFLDESQSRKAFAVFIHHLDRAVYGNAALRFEKRVKVVPVIEKENCGRWHIHAAIELPSHVDAVTFEQLVQQSWSKVDWAYDRVFLRDNADRGWLEYILKRGQKSGLETWSDCIVWESLHNPNC